MKGHSRGRILLSAVVVAVILGLLGGCGVPERMAGATHPIATPTAAPSPTASRTLLPPTEDSQELTAGEVATLESLAQIDGYPLYTMRYYGSYDGQSSSEPGGAGAPAATQAGAWSCSLFAALGRGDDLRYGRNFDWQSSPAVLLFTDPPGGYASVSMVDIAYLGYSGDRAAGLDDRPLAERRGLLLAPALPFDGMNEQGLVVGMAAVDPGDMVPDPAKPTIDSLGVIREMLDHAGTVEEAIAILGRYNVDMGGGPPLHYLIADRSGKAALVEFYKGKMLVLPNESPWLAATNFLRSEFGESLVPAARAQAAAGQCWRYDRIEQTLSEAQGCLDPDKARDLLGAVSQDTTQWSVVYGLNSGQVEVAMGRQYQAWHTFCVDPGAAVPVATATP
jgi:hypothetical protein